MTRSLRWLPALVLLVPTPTPLSAQKRKIEGEVAGSVFFGNTRQTIASTRAMFERKDSSYAFRTGARFNYGELTQDVGGTIVNKRSWDLGTNYDWRPFADFTPFVRATYESSFENRIDRRTSLGVGSRYNVTRTPATDVIVSLGAAGESTLPLPPGDTLGTITLARGSATLRVRRDFTPTVTFTTETEYKPALTDGDDYTITSLNTLKIRLARFAALTLSFRDNFDNMAIVRGARVKNDGELLVGLLTTF